jgi:hypothetical protein
MSAPALSGSGAYARQEDLHEVVRDLLSRMRAASPVPGVGIVEHPEEAEAGQPRLARGEPALLLAAPQHRLDDALELATRLAHVRPLRVVRDDAPLVQEDRHLVLVVGDVVHERVGQPAQRLLRGKVLGGDGARAADR